MLTQLENTAKVVGVKQSRRALNDGRAKGIFLARDADPALTRPLADEAQAKGLPIFWADTMRELGRACGIAVGAAVVTAI